MKDQEVIKKMHDSEEIPNCSFISAGKNKCKWVFEDGEEFILSMPQFLNVMNYLNNRRSVLDKMLKKEIEKIKEMISKLKEEEI